MENNTARIAITRVIYAANVIHQLIFYWIAKDDINFRTLYLILAYGMATYQAAILQFQNKRYYGILQLIYELGQFMGFYFLWTDQSSAWIVGSSFLLALQSILSLVLVKIEAPPEKPKSTWLIVVAAISRMLAIVILTSSGLLYFYLDEDSRLRGHYFHTLQVIFLFAQSVWSIGDLKRLQDNKYVHVEAQDKKEVPKWMYIQAILFGSIMLLFLLSTYVLAIIQIHEGGNPTYDQTVYILIVVSNSLLLSCIPIIGCCYACWSGSVQRDEDLA